MINNYNININDLYNLWKFVNDFLGSNDFLTPTITKAPLAKYAQFRMTRPHIQKRHYSFTRNRWKRFVRRTIISGLRELG